MDNGQSLAMGVGERLFLGTVSTKLGVGEVFEGTDVGVLPAQ